MYCDNETLDCLIYQANLVLSGIIFLGQLAIVALVVVAVSIALFSAWLYIEDGVRWLRRKIGRPA